MMAENEQAQERTEEPTQRRLEKAREDGEVLSSKEMLVFASGASALLILGSLGFFSKGILDVLGITSFRLGIPMNYFLQKHIIRGAHFLLFCLALQFLGYQQSFLFC
jgi:flagellar biosynthesis protein FlhB